MSREERIRRNQMSLSHFIQCGMSLMSWIYLQLLPAAPGCIIQTGLHLQKTPSAFVSL